MNVAIKKLTWDDIKEWPEYHGCTEIVDGELVLSPVPSISHQEICSSSGYGSAVRSTRQSWRLL